MPLTLNQIADIVTATLFEEQDGKITDISPDLLQNYVATRRLLMPNSQTETGGKAIRFDVNVTHGEGADWVGPYTVEQVAIGDSIKQGTDEIRWVRTKFGMDQMEEAWNNGKYAIINVIKNREQNARIKLVEKIETQFWGETAFADRDLKMNGILNLLPYCATTGFVGTYATGYSGVGVHNLSPDTYTGWKSYGGPYAGITQDDLIIKMRTAFTLTNFEAPLDTMLIPDQKRGQKYGLYMNLETRQGFENQLRLQNDSLGDDVAYEDGRGKFKSIPFTYAAALDSNTRNPVLGINWGLLNIHKMKGWWWYPIVTQGANQPTVVNTFIYCALQMITPDRRQLGFNFALAA